MFTIILTIIFTLLAIIGYIASNKILNISYDEAVDRYNNVKNNEHSTPRDKELAEKYMASLSKPSKLIPTVIATTLMTIALGILGANSFTTVPAGFVKVPTLFGKVQNEQLEEGFHLVNPMLEFVQMDARDFAYDIKQIEVPAQDKLKSKMDVTVMLKVVKTSTPNMLRTVGTMEEALNTYVWPKVRSSLREAGKTVRISQDFFKDEVQQQLQSQLLDELRTYLADKGFEVKAVMIRDIDLPEVVRSAIVKTKEREEEINQEKAKLLIVEQIAQKQVKESEAAATAAIQNAKAIETLAKAEAFKIEAEANATAKANIVISKSITPELIKYNAIQQWNGQYPTTLMSGSDSNVLLSLPSTR